MSSRKQHRGYSVILHEPCRMPLNRPHYSICRMITIWVSQGLNAWQAADWCSTCSFRSMCAPLIDRSSKATTVCTWLPQRLIKCTTQHESAPSSACLIAAYSTVTVAELGKWSRRNAVFDRHVDAIGDNSTIIVGDINRRPLPRPTRSSSPRWTDLKLLLELRREALLLLAPWIQLEQIYNGGLAFERSPK